MAEKPVPCNSTDEMLKTHQTVPRAVYTQLGYTYALKHKDVEKRDRPHVQLKPVAAFSGDWVAGGTEGVFEGGSG